MNKKLIAWSFLLFLFVFCIIGLPFTHWWFNGDDFSAIAIAAYAKNGWKGLLDCFLNGNIWQYSYPSNHPLFCLPNEQAPVHFSCFSFYYRPLYCVFYTLGYWLWGFSAYSFFLANAFFHALNTTTLFIIFNYVTTPIPACIAALAFAFHPQIGFRYGAIANLHYYVDLAFILFSFIMTKKYIDTKKYYFYVSACILFLLSLFTRETSILLPIIIFGGSYLYQKATLQQHITVKEKLLTSFYITFGYFISAILYLSIRLYLYPIHKTAGSSQTLLSHITDWIIKLPHRTQEFLVFFYDALGISWLPWGNIPFKIIIILPFVALLLLLFIKNTQKLAILFFTSATIITLWPSLYINYSPRYFYHAYAFILLIFIFLFTFSKVPTLFKKISLSLLSCILLFNITHVIKNLKCREEKLHTLKQGFLALKDDPRIASGSNPLCFIGFPIDGFGTGIDQASWLFLTPPNNPVYVDGNFALTQADSNILISHKLYACCAPYYNKNYFSCIKENNQEIRITSLNPQKIHFFVDNHILNLGKKTIYKTEIIGQKEVITDLKLTLDPKYLYPNPLIITWDYEQKKFIIKE